MSLNWTFHLTCDWSNKYITRKEKCKLPLLLPNSADPWDTPNAYRQWPMPFSAHCPLSIRSRRKTSGQRIFITESAESGVFYSAVVYFPPKFWSQRSKSLDPVSFHVLRAFYLLRLLHAPFSRPHGFLALLCTSPCTHFSIWRFNCYIIFDYFISRICSVYHRIYYVDPASSAVQWCVYAPDIMHRQAHIKQK